MLKTIASRLCFKFSRQFFLKVKPSIQLRNTREVSTRGENGQFKEIVIFPASSVYVSLFFVSLIQESVSCSIIDEVHYGLKWFHDLAGQPDPCNSPVVIQLLESAKRILSVPVKKKEPVTPEVIQRLVAYYGSASASLANLRLLTLCVLGYAGFFRFNELVQLRRCDFQFEDSFMRIFVQRSKTDIYRDGAWVVIAKTFKPTCPVLLTLRYFAVASFSVKTSFFVHLLSVVVMDLTDFADLFHCPILGHVR